MNAKTLEKIINECSNLYDTLPPEQLSTWNVFVSANNIAAKYDNVECMMNLTFGNGDVTQGICVITDWEPGALLLQSDDGSIPKLRVVFPEEFAEIMLMLEPIFTAEYPPVPKEQDGSEE